MNIIELFLQLLGLSQPEIAGPEPISGPEPEPTPVEPTKIETIEKTSQNGRDFIARFEGLRLKPYLDSVGIPTIGIGCTYYEDGTKVKMTDPAITEERAYALFANILKPFEADVSKLVIPALNQNQFDALVSFTYNVGSAALQRSTLLKLVNKSQFKSAANEFVKWNKAGGKVLDGLTKRRLAEKDLFLS